MREAFPDADVSHERGTTYNGRPEGKLTITASNGVQVASVTQREVSREYAGPAIAQLKVRAVDAPPFYPASPCAIPARPPPARSLPHLIPIPTPAGAAGPIPRHPG